MKMRRCVAASILLMLSLEATLLVTGLLSVADDVGTTLLPSQGKGTARANSFISLVRSLAASSVDRVVHEETDHILARRGLAHQVAMAVPMPWKCCDVTSCTRSIPPICSCMPGRGRQLGSNLQRLHPPRRVCLDRYTTGDPGPKCTEEAN
nr:predicted protein [Triticum aestivum]BDI54649.1 predicted protein [Triticum aestivum]